VKNKDTLGSIVKEVIRESNLMRVTTPDKIDIDKLYSADEFIDEWNKKQTPKIDRKYFINDLRKGLIPSWRAGRYVYVDPIELNKFFKSKSGQDLFAAAEKKQKAFAANMARPDPNAYDQRGPRPGSNWRGD